MRYTLTGISCGNCAAKVEQELRKVKGLENAAISFEGQSLEIPPEHLEQARQVIQQVEPEVKVHINTAEAAATERAVSPRLYTIAATSLLFIAGLVFKDFLGRTPYSWAEYTVMVSAYLLVGWPVLRRAYNNLVRRQFFDEHFLMSTATLGAISIRHLHEAVAVMLLYAIGEFFQDKAVNSSRRAIASLAGIRPDTATLIDGGKLKSVPPHDVEVGQTIVVKPGEKIPLDGYILEGNSFVDTSVLTGESVPRKVVPGKKVLAGMINGHGLLTIQVSNLFEDSSVVRILHMVEEAAGRKAPTDRFLTVFARYYTPAVVAGAVLLALVPPLLTAGDFSAWIYRALVLLVISCPCALVISVPLSYFGGLGSASRQGILVKGANYLDALVNAKMVVFDKTGTLTRGVFKVNEIRSYNGFTREQVLELAAAVEQYSNHPIAQSILQAYAKPVPPGRVTNFREVAGRGIRAEVDGKSVLVGNEKILPGIIIEPGHPGGTCTHVVVDDVYAGYITITDEMKTNAREAVRNLRNLGIKKTFMLTGDEKIAAGRTAAELELDGYYAGLLPEDKVAVLEELQSSLEKPRKEKLLYIGDGINDAPVLARADVGIAMGALGSDAAIEAADVVLMDDNPAKVVTAIKVARYTNVIVLQNVILTLGIKALFIIMGTFGLAGIWEAVFADVGITLLAVLNSARALKYRAV